MSLDLAIYLLTCTLKSDAVLTTWTFSQCLFSLPSPVLQKHLAVATCFQERSCQVLTWQEVSVDISQYKAKLFFIVWSSSLSRNRRHNYTQQLPWLHIPWDQINFSWFGPSLWHLVYPLFQILSQWMHSSSPLQKVIPSIWGCACKIDSTDIQKHLCLSVACSWQFGLKTVFMSGYS